MIPQTGYRATFDRIGASSVEPLIVPNAACDDDIEGAIYTYARSHLGNQQIEVTVQMDDQGQRGSGLIYVHANYLAGTFIVERLDAPGGDAR